MKGIPPIWNPPATVPSLEPDSGPRYVDQNADRNPVSPLAALIHAVHTGHPKFDFTSINVLTDRRPIRKLYGLVAGDRSSFEFGVTILGSTALFTRMEKESRDEPNNQIREYRRAFETAYLKIPVSAKGSTSHHRVVQYVFRGMNFLVRSAVDAYLPDQVSEPEPASGVGKTGSEELTDFVKAMSLDEPATYFQSTITSSVVVIPGGRQIPHAATAELSTRRTMPKWAGAKSYLCAKKMPDLWISQTANFIEAYHTYNEDTGFRPHASQGNWRSAPRRSTKASSQPQLTRFNDIKIKPLKEELVAWETANARLLSKLLTLIKKVIEATTDLGGTCIVSHDELSRVLNVSRAKKGEVPGLPEKLQKCFMQPTRAD
ncbi:hypothetical protein IMSHALPRED_003999 [Imshaugia aleurites]|uniref:Uncharacterized protein n=1 Tax=Imshaugia aleurites TaxID=172621 RepID=A0A8H3HWZ1_9LECA|nr:hypothetical protein IMSHALPRED_003999 [Imshaugia aleurites]